jgi:hypothetical protein
MDMRANCVFNLYNILLLIIKLKDMVSTIDNQSVQLPPVIRGAPPCLGAALNRHLLLWRTPLQKA